MAASNLVKGTARDVLRGMISDFYFPEGVKQTSDDITAWMETYAYNINAKVRDPKTGEIVGHMRELMDAKQGRTPRQPQARKMSRIEQKREERRKAARAKVQAQQEPSQ